MKYSVIFGQIQTFIRNATPKVLKANHATVEENILKSVFSVPVLDNLTTQTYIEKVIDSRITSGSLLANVSFRQVGGQIRISGNISNTTNASFSNIKVFFFKDNDFTPSDIVDENDVFDRPIIAYGIATNLNGNNIRVAVSWQLGVPNLRVMGSFPNDNLEYNFNFLYDQKQ